MNFSEALRVTSSQLSWSPNGKLLAIAVTARLEIRDGSSLQLLSNFNCFDVITKIEWSPDSSLISTSNIQHAIIEVWQPARPSWRCKIDEGSVGLVKFSWAPDSRHILTTAEFHLRITVWSLTNKSVSYIKYPKEGTPGYHFSHDGDYLAVAERRDCKDFISILETKSWHLVKNFECATRDLAGVSFCPDDSVIAVWDSAVEYKIFIYTLSGQCVATYSAYQWALGIKSVAWSPSSQFLAIGSYDQTIRLMNHITWKVIADFTHSSSIEKTDCHIYMEVEKPLTGYPATLASIQGLPGILETCYEEATSRPINFTQIPLYESKKSTPKIGVSCIVFSSDGRYLASRVENMPAVVWIWSIVAKPSLHTILVHCNSVKDMAWSRNQTCLSLCTGGNHIYLWTPFGCLTVAVPNSPMMQINSLKWHLSSSKLALIGKNEFSIAFLNSTLEKTQKKVEEG